MESTATILANGNSWEIVPSSAATGIILGVLIIYLFFRHFMFMLLFTDLILGGLRKLNWFPKEGKRMKTFIHLVIALTLVLGFFSVGRELMESTRTTLANGSSWEIIPGNTGARIILGALIIYLFFRHFMFMLMFTDLILGWLRKFNWFPKEGKRMKTFIHWVIALMLWYGFLSIAGSAGWLKFIPQ
ncbi:MAG: hypothetical protein N4A53_12500 [Pelagimonas sp.]|nr:hypothetical protein [Pelagimonas sp.]